MTRNLLALILELQALEGFENFSLAGGSNLAVRFQHRNSVDIDLFSSEIVGVKGWQVIEKAVRAKFGKAVLFSDILNKELGEQYCFFRALIIKGEEQIKLDMIQNIQCIDNAENISSIRMLSVRDIGLFKLMAASNRFARKDIYDLDLITDHFELGDLLANLKEKQEKFKEDHYKCLFDLDQEKNPLNDIKALLSFEDAIFESSNRRHTHSSDRLDLLKDSKTWPAAKLSWKKKIRILLNQPK